jgi:VIT1/CCC1 family predicted Fe2+/Mn2+ transporter
VSEAESISAEGGSGKPTVADGLEHSHDPDEIAHRLAQPPGRSYLKDAIYGGVDGAVTTFAVVSGVAGAGLSPSIVIILGVANLVGDGFSMAAGNYLGTRAENQQFERLREIERKHIKHCPDGEREEIRQIFRGQGFEGTMLEDAVHAITADESRWVDIMLHNEYGLSLHRNSPTLAATMTFVSFMFVGAVPLLPFLIQWLRGGNVSQFWVSATLTGIAFFAIGAIKASFVAQRWWWSGGETLLVGSLAALLAYLCGYLLSGLV